MISRMPHIIKGNKSCRYPRQYIFFDTETKENKINDNETEHKLLLGVAIYWEWRSEGRNDTKYSKTFYKIKEFWDFVEYKNLSGKRLIIVAHNIGFDMKIVKGFEELKKRGYTIKKLIINGTTNIWEFRKEKKTIVFLDNMNYFKSSLARLGESIGIPKLEMPKVRLKNKELEKYCYNDVEIMIQAWSNWLKFLRSSDLGVFGKTIASQAFNAYRHRFMPHKIYVHTNLKVTALERLGYYGGRTECFFIGQLPKEKYYYVDVNSMYPYVMSKTKLPTKLRGYLEKPSKNRIKELLKTYCITAEVILKTNENIYPARHENRLCFPIGEFKTVINTRELEIAFKRGHVKKVLRASIYEANYIFKEYVKYFYKVRNQYKEENNHSFSFMCKILLNSLYGKFGQKNEVYEEIEKFGDFEDGYYTEFDMDTNEEKKYRVINGQIEQKMGYKEGFNSFPAIAGHVTSDSRILLYEYIEKAGKENVFYCDTDSLFLNQAGYDKIKKHIKKGVLGKLSIEDKSENLIIRGLKDYIFGNKEHIKGVRSTAEQINKNTYKQIRFEGLKGALRKKRLNTMIVSYETKTLTRNYTKGIVQPDGKIYPLKLSL